ncbi:hypothetical protein JCM17380_16180 [Desulfosporosinus burensis]
MKRLALLFITLSLVFLMTLFGCSKNNTVSGIFIKQNYSKEYIQLKSDGTFKDKDSLSEINGKYTINGDKLTMDYKSESVTATINGNTIIFDKNGLKYTKE